MKYLQLFAFVILAVFVLVGIAYRFVVATTPAWLDYVVYGGAGVSLLVLLAIGREK
jgi:hypothetical protein